MSEAPTGRTTDGMPVAIAVDSATSAAWAGTRPSISAVVATHNRRQFLAGLLDCLEAQSPADAELVVVDDGSTDGTWPLLRAWAAATPRAAHAIRLSGTGGPSVPRNTGFAASRADLVAFTDDDCCPAPGWLGALHAAFREDVVLVQGPTRGDGPRPAPWSRSIEVAEPSPLFETCNLAVRRGSFESAGGFPVVELLRRGARGFGEDALLGARLARSGQTAWAADAVVVHRWLPGTYLNHLQGQWRLRGFPFLAKEIEAVARRTWRGPFLNRRTAALSLGLAATAVAAARGRTWWLIGWAPWVQEALPDARWRSGRRRQVPLRLAQLWFGDLVGAAALWDGSLRHRRLLI